MTPARTLRLTSGLLTAACILSLASGDASARSVTVIPRTNHAALTMSTDGTYGFQVLPGKALMLDLVGPGELTLTIRLNHSRKSKSFQGQVDFKRDNKRIKRTSLKLFRSRVGAYNEDSSIHPSMPKIFKIKVPNGLQNYSFSLRAKRGTSMTLGIDYDTEADQGAAQASDDLALVPLVPPGDDALPPDDVDLVPLSPIVPPADKTPPEDKPPADAVAAAKPGKPTTIVVPKPPDKPAGPGRTEPVGLAAKPTPFDKKPDLAAVPKPADTRPLVADGPRKVETIEPPKAKPDEVQQAAPPGAPSAPFLSIGIKLGEISPLQNIGSASFTAALDLRYVLPVLSGRLSLGVEAGYHQFSASLGYANSTTRTNVDILVVPISLQLFYRIPLGTFIEPFVGIGGDLLIGFGEVAYADAPDTATSGSGIGFGGHLSAGAEAKLGPGYLLLEVRAGISKMDLGVVDNLNATGLAVVAGYRFEI